MSCKQRRATNLFLILFTVYFSTFQRTSTVRLEQQKDGFRTHQRQEPSVNRERSENHPEQRGQRLLEESDHPGVSTVQDKPAADSQFSIQKPDETDWNFPLNTSFWTISETSQQPKSPWNSGNEYQSDFTDFDVFKGKVSAPSFDSSPLFKSWQAMRPLVQCGDNVMTFTASGGGVAHLLVDRGGASPISPFHLPPHCGYTVRTTWTDLEMMVSYDACYITQENGSYVLPLLWGGSPLKLSCPVKGSAPNHSSHSAPSVFCSSYGMGIQILWQEQEIPKMGVMVNGGWSPFVSDDCAYRTHSHPGHLAFFVSSSSPCIFSGGDGLHLQLIIDDRGYILSCPISSHHPQSYHIPDPVGPASTTPQPQTQGQAAQPPEYPHHHYPYPGFHYQQLYQVNPPGPQPVSTPRPTHDSPPGLQLKAQRSIYPAEPGKLPYSPEDPPPPQQENKIPDLVPAPEKSPQQLSQLPIDHNQYMYGGYYPYVSMYDPAVTSTQTKTATETDHQYVQLPQPPSNPYHHLYYPQVPFYPEHTSAPITQAPAFPPSPPSPPPPSPPKQPKGASQHPVDPIHPPSSHYNYEQVLHPNPRHSPLPEPSSKEKSQTPPQNPESYPIACLPFGHTICSYYPYPYFPYYHVLYPTFYQPFYPPVPQYPQTPPQMITATAPTPASSTTTPTPPKQTQQTPHLQCMMEKMVIFLPFAHSDSIQVRAQPQLKSWLSLSSVPPQCGYLLQEVEGSGVYLHSPLPACHSQLKTPSTISLPLRFWDLSLAQYRTLDLQCPHHTVTKTPAKTTPSPPATLPYTTKGKLPPSVVPKPEVFCYSYQMNVELPPGPVSEIVVQDIQGNQMKLQDAPKHCGYSAKKGKEGEVRLTLQLHSRCHMSVQGKMYIITVYYMTVTGRREAQFSCPVIIPVPEQNCNLPSEQRLPCGHSSVSQAQCLSTGCCFSKQPPACYYPMDECTIDRHFVFTVPASLTEPPLNPALLVAAGNSSCKPQRVTSDYALFKIPMDGCGTRRVMVGKTMIYMVEMINKVQTISLNYGTITRDSPVRLLVECRYVPNTLLSVSYMVKTPTLGPEVQSKGMLGVQLRIAKDAMYSSYYPQYHQPLQMLLGKPLYLEVRLINTPDPSLVLLVHFCVAYPRSGKAVWLLLYNGCPNALDQELQQAVLTDPAPTSPRAQTRRFTISTFQFLPDGEFKDPDEEIYFMCSTEICSPRDGPCVEGCFGQ